MAAPIWLGGTTAVTEVDDFTPANVQVADVFTLTLADEAGVTLATVSFTATVATVANVTAGLAAAWQANAIAVLYATAADNTTTVKLTAKTTGVPFYVTSSATDGGGANTQTLTRAATIPNVGPNDWNTNANWSTGTKPAASDDPVADARGAANAILYGLNQSSITLTSFTYYRGGPQIGTSAFALKISATTWHLQQAPTDGSSPSGSFVNINGGTNAGTYNVYGGPNSGLSGLAGVTIAGSHASNVLNVYSGVVDVGMVTAGQSCNFPTINVLGQSAKLTTGTGTDFTTCTNNGATVYLGKGSTSGTLTNTAGTTTVSGATKVGTINAYGGTVNINQRPASGNTVDSLNMNGGIVDSSGNAAAATIATTTWLDGGGQIVQFKPTQLTFTAIAFSFTKSTRFIASAA
jgi:hypothetical protein